MDRMPLIHFSIFLNHRNLILDLECGGFTYKGVKGVNQPFLTYFFRVLPNYKVLAKAAKTLLENDKQERIWTSYKVKRKFLLLPGENLL